LHFRKIVNLNSKKRIVRVQRPGSLIGGIEGKF